MFTGHGCLGELFFNRHYIVCKALGAGIIIADELGKSGKICLVSFAHLLGVVGVFKIIVAVAEAETALLSVHGIAVNIEHVGFNTCEEERA